MTSSIFNVVNIIGTSINTLSVGSWFMGQLRGFFLALDKFVYSFVTILYNLIYDLANLSFFTSGDLGFITQRIYTLLAIFMLFRVTFSLITYVIAPDQFSDKTAGLQNLIRNVVISFILIIMSPWIFTKMYDVQNAILNENVIPQFVLGEGSSGLESTVVMSERCCKSGIGTNGVCVNSDFYKLKPASTGDYMALVALKPFFQLDETTTDSEISYSTYCYVGGSETVTASQYLNANDVSDENAAKKFTIDYTIFFSTASGILLAAILISFCFDIAIRSFNLAFLQIFAPIPIISFVDPKSAKSGMFNKYVKTTMRVWMGVFIRIAAFSFAIFFIQLISNNISNGFTLASGEKPKSPTIWIGLFAIIGALMFAKKFPKFLEEITGLKLDGSFKLNPLSRIKDEAIGGKMISSATKTAQNVGKGTAAMAIGAVGGIGAGVAAQKALGGKGKDLWKGAGSGFLHGGMHGMATGYKAKGFGGTLKSAAGSVTKAGQDVTKYAGTKMGDRMAASFTSKLGAKTIAQRMDDEVKINEEIGKMKDAIMGAADVKDDFTDVEYRYKDADGSEHTLKSSAFAQYDSSTGKYTGGAGVKSLKKKLEDVEKSGASAETIAAYRNLYEKSQASYVNEHLRDSLNGKESQVGMLALQLKNLYEKNQEFESVKKLDKRMGEDGFVESLGSLKGMFGDTKDSITSLQSGTTKVDGKSWQEAHSVDNAIKKSK